MIETQEAAPQQPAQGTKSLTDIVPLNQGQLNTMYAEAYYLAQQGNHERAASMFTVLCVYQPEEPKYPHAVGVCYQKLGWHAMAIPAFARTVVLRPSGYAPRFQIVECMLHLGRQEEAIEHLNLIAESAQEDGETEAIERASAMLGFLQARAH